LRSLFLVIEVSRTLKLHDAALRGLENTFSPVLLASWFNLSKLEIGITTSPLTSKTQALSIFCGIFFICLIFSVTSSHSIPFHLVIALVSIPSLYTSSIPKPSNLNSMVYGISFS